MEKSPKGDDALDQAKSIIEASKKDAQLLTLTLSIDAMRTVIPVITTTCDWIVAADEDSKTDKELATLLNRKCEDLIEAILPEGMKRSQIPSTFSLEMSGQEMDFLNEHLLKGVDVSRRVGRKDAKPFRELALEGVSNNMACLVQLNTAFIAAGGLPRPSFVKFREGS